MMTRVSIPLDDETAARLKRAAAALGESVEALAAAMVGAGVEDLDPLLEHGGDDGELARRVDRWRANKTSVDASDVRAWLRALHTDPQAPRPPFSRE